jgi:hypothetical protein
MSEGTFAELVTRARERINGECENIRAQQRELQAKLASIEREFAAIQAYEDAKSRKISRVGSSAGQQTRARRGSKREEILAVLEDNPHRFTRGEILVKLGLEGNKAGEMSVSNALTALTKLGTMVRRDGKYIGGVG